MDIRTFYKHAKQWKMDRDAIERENEIRRLEKIKEAWKPAARAIKDLFPVEGIQVRLVDRDTFQDLPDTGGLYYFDVVLPGSESNKTLPAGVIRLALRCVAPDAFAPAGYVVFDEGRDTSFDDPFSPFLAACKSIGYQSASE